MDSRNNESLPLGYGLVLMVADRSIKDCRCKMKVIDYVKNNNGNRIIAINQVDSIENIGLFNDRLYRGRLADVTQYFDKEVVNEGYAIGEQINILTILQK